MTIVEAATGAAQSIAQVVTRFNTNTFQHLSQLPHLDMGLSRLMGLSMGWAGFFGWPMKARARRPLPISTLRRCFKD